MNVSINFTIPDPLQLLVYIVIGLIAALLVGALARMRSTFGYVVATVLGAFGAWLFANVLQIQVLGDIAIQKVPLIQAFIGALLFALVGALLFARRTRVVVDE